MMCSILYCRSNRELHINQFYGDLCASYFIFIQHLSLRAMQIQPLNLLGVLSVTGFGEQLLLIHHSCGHGSLMTISHIQWVQKPLPLPCSQRLHSQNTGLIQQLTPLSLHSRPRKVCCLRRHPPQFVPFSGPVRIAWPRALEVEFPIQKKVDLLHEHHHQFSRWHLGVRSWRL